jgi:D-Tyr-tRNA(Tyr) deacylase
VLVGGQVVAAIEPDSQGLLAFVGVTHDDDVATAQRMAEKLWRLRILDAERSAGLDPMWWTRDLWLESGRRFASVIATKFTAVSGFQPVAFMTVFVTLLGQQHLTPQLRYLGITIGQLTREVLYLLGQLFGFLVLGVTALAVCRCPVGVAAKASLRAHPVGQRVVAVLVPTHASDHRRHPLPHNSFGDKPASTSSAAHTARSL